MLNNLNLFSQTCNRFNVAKRVAVALPSAHYMTLKLLPINKNIDQQK